MNADQKQATDHTDFTDLNSNLRSGREGSHISKGSSNNMQFIYNYLFLAMWLVYLGYWRAISKNVKQNVRLEAFASRFTRLLMIVCAAALLLVPRVPFAFLNRRFLPARSIKLLDRRRDYRKRFAILGLGAPAHRKELEQRRHCESRPRTDYHRSLRARATSDLYRAADRIPGFSRGSRRVARDSGFRSCRHCAVDQTAPGRNLDARAFRVVVRRVFPACESAGAVYSLMTISAATRRG